MSKGSTPRPVDKDKFDNNFDAIFGKKLPVYQRKQLEEDISKSQITTWADDYYHEDYDE